MSNEIKETFRFLSEKPSLKIVVSSGDVIEFSPYYITQDEGVAAELRKIPNIYEVDSLQGASVNPLPGKMILRDAEGRAKAATPAEADDIATKGYTDTGLATKAEAVHRHNKNNIDGLEGLDNLVKSVNGRLPDIEGNVTLPLDSVKTVNAQLPDEFGNITIRKDHIGLDMVDNTPDIDKPVSTPAREAINKALNDNFACEKINFIITNNERLVGILFQRPLHGLDTADTQYLYRKFVGKITIMDNKLYSHYPPIINIPSAYPFMQPGASHSFLKYDAPYSKDVIITPGQYRADPQGWGELYILNPSSILDITLEILSSAPKVQEPASEVKGNI